MTELRVSVTQNPISRLGNTSLFCCVALAGALIWLGCAGSPGQTDASEDPQQGTEVVNVEVVSPARDDIVRTISLPTSVEADQQAKLYSKVSGYLDSISVDIGDRVRDGQLLAKIDVPEIVNQHSEAEAGLAVARPTAAGPKQN